MAKFLTRSLSSETRPDAWRSRLTSDKSPGDAPFCFDIFRRSDQLVEVISRVEGLTQDEIKSIQFSGAIRVGVTPIPRGTRFTLHGDFVDQQKLAITCGDKTIEPVLRARETHLFTGLNSLFTITLDPVPEVLCDWIGYHCASQGAEAALIFIRSGYGAEFSEIRAETEASVAGIEGLKTVVWVEVDVPLGHPELPAETSRHLAPNAPGKGNLPEPVHDPWRSPITEIAILEVARQRFLSDARAVLYCQPADLTVTPSGRSVFDLTANGPGFLKYRGRRAYPFKLGETQPRHGDHSCISFDGDHAENIWCAAPSQLEPNAFWRQFRVANTETPEAREVPSYWRFMALRHPDLSVSELVPKSSLIQNDALLKLVKSNFGTDPKTPPISGETPKPLKNDRILIVTTMKNEGPFILEWLAFHRAIGVTDFLVYTNDCTDGTDDMFDLLEKKGIVAHRENPFKSMDMPPQHAAYQAASETELAAAADWIICMDVDEFINIHVGDGTLNALFDAVPDATMISLTWRLFGNADVAGFEDRPIVDQLNQCAHEMARKPHQAWGFKTLFRNLGHYKKFGVHRPKGLKPEYLDDINWVNGSGQIMPPKMLRTGWRSSTRTVGYDLVTLNHYALRSAESFLVKRDRGRVNHVDRDQGLAYWFRMNHNAEKDTSIATKFALFQAEFAKLMADPEIKAMHDICVDRHKIRIAELMAASEYQNLYEEITGERLRALSRMLALFGNQVFLDGPDAVPEDFHLTYKG